MQRLFRRIALKIPAFLPAANEQTDVGTTFLLRDVDEMSTKDAAGRLGISIPAVKTRLHRARKVLRESLGSYVAC
jgi:DNA-directed RNA polymerase specialized sigma subunit, sigma24 homolog